MTDIDSLSTDGNTRPLPSLLGGKAEAEEDIPRAGLLCAYSSNKFQATALTQISLDTTGLRCPLPLFKLRRALRDLAPGERIEVLSTDPLAPGDFRELCEAMGHQLIETRQQEAIARTLIQVGARGAAVKD